VSSPLTIAEYATARKAALDAARPADPHDERVAAIDAAIEAGEDVTERVAELPQSGADAQVRDGLGKQGAIDAINAGRQTFREHKAEAHREKMLRAPAAAGNAPLVERQRGATRERRSARSSAASGDSGDDSGLAPSDEPPPRPALERAVRRTRGP
jgi:hypothetical protein